LNLTICRGKKANAIPIWGKTITWLGQVFAKEKGVRTPGTSGLASRQTEATTRRKAMSKPRGINITVRDVCHQNTPGGPKRARKKRGLGYSKKEKRGNHKHQPTCGGGAKKI